MRKTPRQGSAPAIARALAAGCALLAVLAWSSAAAAKGSTEIARQKRVEVVFALDTTGSMSGLIEGAKSKIWSIADRMASAQGGVEVRIGLVGYRDRGDAYVTRFFDLSDDIDTVYAKLRAFQAEGGGDTPESVNQALHEAITLPSWTAGAGVYRVVFLVGDAPPQMGYANDVRYERSLALAAERGIVVNAVQCGEAQATAAVWREIAGLGEGEYVAIAADGGMLALATPLDARLAELQRELGDTVVAYGAASERDSLTRKVARSMAAGPGVAASRLAYLDKTGGAVVSGKSDLVDDLASGRVRLEQLPAAALPSELAGLEAEEQRDFVERKAEQRKALQQRVGQLVGERERWLADERARRSAAGEDGGFDEQVLEAVREQAAKVGIEY